MSVGILRQLDEALAGDHADEELPTALVVLASLAGADVDVYEEEAHAAARRALLLLTAGGDPDRGLDLNGRAVQAIADDLRTSDRQLQLERGIDDLYGEVSRANLAHAIEAVKALRATPDVAWRAYACSLLAEELAGEDY